MAKITFDEAANRLYENGVDHGILYTGADWTGVAWNGLTSIDTAPDGGETEALWADNIKYAVMRGAVSYAATINCYSYPEEFNECLGNVEIVEGSGVKIGEQIGTNFRMHYRTAINNAEKGLIGYRHHVVYGLACDPSDKTYESINDSPEAVEFAYDVEGSPAQFTKGSTVRTGCEFTFDEMIGNTDTKIQAILDILYGTANVEAKCPDPDTLFAGLVA